MSIVNSVFLDLVDLNHRFFVFYFLVWEQTEVYFGKITIGKSSTFTIYFRKFFDGPKTASFAPGTLCFPG